MKMKIRHVAAFVATALILTTGLTGCGKIKLPFGKKDAATPTPQPVAAAAATPAPAVESASAAATGPGAAVAPTPAPKQAVDRNAQVVVLCYHRLEGKAG